MKAFLSSVALCALSMLSPAQAATVTLTWVDSGAYNTFGDHDPLNTNYIAGNCTDCANGQPGGTYRNFFVFDTSALQGTVTYATLRLRSGSVPNEGLYSVFDATTAIAALRAGGSGRTDIYADLGSGVQYGSTWVLPTDAVTGPSLVDVALNNAALAAINGSDGLFALGGSFASVWHAFGGTDTDERRQLILEVSAVPEPSSVALLGAGLALAGLALRRASRTALARKDLWTVRA